jgi:cold shock CspA family protein
VQVERALACRRDNGFAEGLRLAADVAEKAGRIDAAREYLLQLARLLPDDPTPAAHAAALDGSLPAQILPDPPLPSALAILDDEALDVPAAERLTGVVDRFFPDKGFGFVRYDDGQSIFFHVTQCESETSRIVPGTRVTFFVGHNPKKGKPQAESLRVLD